MPAWRLLSMVWRLQPLCFDFHQQTALMAILMRQLGLKQTIIVGLVFEMLQLFMLGFFAQHWWEIRNALSVTLLNTLFRRCFLYQPFALFAACHWPSIAAMSTCILCICHMSQCMSIGCVSTACLLNMAFICHRLCHPVAWSLDIMKWCH